MSKSNKHKMYRLSEVKPAYEEAVGTAGGKVEFEGTDGKVYAFTHPLFFSHEEREALQDANTEQEIAQALLGDQYEDFVVGGNDLDALGLLFGSIQQESQEKAQKVRITRF